MERMKRKRLLSAAIGLGILVFLFVLAVPAAPLWAQLGIEPICIRGNWPDLRVVSCLKPSTAPMVNAPLPLTTLSAQATIPIIVDDDGSPDGIIALLYFLRNPLFDVRAVTISCGEAHPEAFARHVKQLLAGLGRTGIPVGTGRATPLEGSNAFPEPWRESSDSFWGISFPQAPAPDQPIPAAELIAETLTSSSQPVMVFVSGNHTNLAEALRLEPGIVEHIRDIHIMGGSVNIPGNIENDWPAIRNSVAEWNIWVDPVAAGEVFASGLPLQLTPLDATNQVIWTESDAALWASSGAPESALAADLLQWMLQSWSQTGVYLWDLVTAVNATDPDLCPKVPFSLDVNVAPGPEQGRTVITGQPPNVMVCLEPDTEQIKALATGVLGRK
jgi:pyrimidine-specific ribonucleoside hydrolase